MGYQYRPAVEILNHALRRYSGIADDRSENPVVVEAVVNRFPEFGEAAAAAISAVQDGAALASLQPGLLAALAETLGLPESYFFDWRVTTTVDVITAVGSVLNLRGTVMVGPCRVPLWDPIARSVVYCRWMNEISHGVALVDDSPLAGPGISSAKGRVMRPPPSPLLTPRLLTPREQCIRILAELGVRPPLTLTELVAAVERHINRRIRLAPERLSLAGLFGCTHTENDVEVVQYQALAPVSQQVLIILHELVHLLMGHSRRAVPLDATVLWEHFPRSRSLLHLVASQVLGEEGRPSPAATVVDEARSGLLEDFRALLGETETKTNTTAPLSLFRSEAVSVALYGEYNEWQAETMATTMLEWIETGGKRQIVGNRSRGILESLGEPSRW